jgi:hypothetical protein
MMLGADPKGLADESDAVTAEDACPSKEDPNPPMHSWWAWWFVRTYLQSLGQVRAPPKQGSGSGGGRSGAVAAREAGPWLRGKRGRGR